MKDVAGVLGTILFIFVIVAIFFSLGWKLGYEKENASEAPQADPSGSPAQPILQGEHKLRKMAERVESESRLSGGFFLIVGNVDGKSKSIVSVKFAWEMNDGTYAISSLPLEKIRVKFDENVTKPTIKFRWQPWNQEHAPQVQELLDNYVLYAVVTVKDNDWPVQIQLPLNKPAPAETPRDSDKSRFGF